MTRRSARRGDRLVVPQCTASDWLMAHDITVIAETVTRLGCGCTRVETTRPGPADGPLGGAMHLLVDRCEFHAANPPAGYGAEPERLEAADERAHREQLEQLGITP